MTLKEVVLNGQDLEIQCKDCQARTPLDPDFFLIRRGDIGLAELRADLSCPGCGSDEIGLTTRSARVVLFP